MKKILATFFIFCFLFFFNPFLTGAQTGQFGCNFTGSSGGCRIGSNTCAADYEPFQGYCNAFTFNEDACNQAPSIPCVPTTGGVDIVNAVSGPPLTCPGGGAGIDTAIGCIPLGSDGGQGIAGFFLRWGLGIAGGIALFLIVYAGILISTAYGDPRKLQAGKELLTAAVSGLILLVMSAYILNIIGVDILGIL